MSAFTVLANCYKKKIIESLLNSCNIFNVFVMNCVICGELVLLELYLHTPLTRNYRGSPVLQLPNLVDHYLFNARKKT